MPEHLDRLPHDEQADTETICTRRIDALERLENAWQLFFDRMWASCIDEISRLWVCSLSRRAEMSVSSCSVSFSIARSPRSRRVRSDAAMTLLPATRRRFE